jgi:hypothetical protein
VPNRLFPPLTTAEGLEAVVVEEGLGDTFTAVAEAVVVEEGLGDTFTAVAEAVVVEEGLGDTLTTVAAVGLVWGLTHSGGDTVDGAVWLTHSNKSTKCSSLYTVTGL